VSESDRAQPAPEKPPQSWSDTDLEALIRHSGARPIGSIEDLDRYALDVWESDEEFEAFLAHVRAQRNDELA
jgi:hypothetical protein